jgi:hypothetical protein
MLNLVVKSFGYENKMAAARDYFCFDNIIDSSQWFLLEDE